MLDVRYEELVAETRPTIERLLDFCSVPWDESCLRFHETERLVATASYKQVRKPVYNSSVGRWKHYEEYLGPLLSALHTESRT